MVFRRLATLMSGVQKRTELLLSPVVMDWAWKLPSCFGVLKRMGGSHRKVILDSEKASEEKKAPCNLAIRRSDRLPPDVSDKSRLTSLSPFRLDHSRVEPRTCLQTCLGAGFFCC